MAPMTFERACKAVRGSKPPHLLLGNGFSRACRDDIFSYDSLFDRADFQEIPLFGQMSASAHARRQLTW
jgi:hypothetical protein